MEFAHPALLFALPLAGLPWLLQRLLRGRAPAVRFPAVAFLQEALSRGQRKRRAQNYALLAARSAILAIATLCLAAPRCASEGADAAIPRTSLLLLDNSLSTHFVNPDGTRRIDELLADAQAWLDEWRQQGAVGRVALTLTDRDADAVSPTGDMAEIRALLKTAAGGRLHGAPLGAALQQVAAQLGPIRDTAARLVIWTDGRRSAWRDVNATALRDLEKLSIEVRTPLVRNNGNLWLTNGAPSAWLRNVAGQAALRLGAQGSAPECWISGEDAQGGTRRFGPFASSAGQERPVELRLAATAERFAAYRLTLAPEDRLSADQTTYFVAATRERPLVWRLSGGGAPGDDLTGWLLATLLAPPALDPERQRVALELWSVAELMERGASGGRAAREAQRGDQEPPTSRQSPALLLACHLPELDEASRLYVRGVIERGATLLLAPAAELEHAARMPFANWFADGALEVKATAAVGIVAERATAGLDAPRAAVTRRLACGRWRSEARVSSRYSDGSPAVLEIDVGRGRVALLTTSPAPSWSDLGIGAGPLIDWLFRLLDRDGPDETAALQVGDRDRRAFSGLPEHGVVRVRDVFDRSAAAVAIAVRERAPLDDWPTAKPGVYEIAAGVGSAALAMYSVNYPPEESDLTEIEASEIAERLGREAQLRHLGESPSAAAPLESEATSTPPLLPWLLLAALALEFVLSLARDRARSRIVPTP